MSKSNDILLFFVLVEVGLGFLLVTVALASSLSIDFPLVASGHLHPQNLYYYRPVAKTNSKKSSVYTAPF